MPTVGPQLPPHLVKRKRSPEDDGSPPTKAPKATNPNEIALDDSDDDDAYGPGAPAPAPARASPGPQKPPIGPSMPSTLAKKNADEIDLSGSDSDSGPAPAMGPSARPEPSTQPARKPAGPSMPPSNTSTPAGPAPKRTYGPSLPPPSGRPASPSDSDSDSDYGPALPSTSRRPAKPLPQAAPEAPSKRDDWMLAPPTPTGPRAPDPTKLKNRSFRSGPGAAATPSSGVPSIWTETPEEKLSRLQDAVLGRGSDPAAPPASAARDDAEQRRRVEAFTEQTRGKSLYEERKEAKKAGRERKEEEDDPSARPFDREKDMALGGKLGAAQKREFVGKAANFGDRFSKGSFL